MKMDGNLNIDLNVDIRDDSHLHSEEGEQGNDTALSVNGLQESNNPLLHDVQARVTNEDLEEAEFNDTHSVESPTLHRDTIRSEGEAESFEISSTSVYSLDEELTNPVAQAETLAARLEIGCNIKDLDQAYLLYCEYARLIGFSVKKGTQSYFHKTNIVRMKMFFCSSEGHTDNRASSFKMAVYKKQHYRTDCRARLRVTRDANDQWIVSAFVTEHNHELLGPDDSYVLRSSRNLSLVKRSVLEQFNDAGIGVSQAFRFVQNSVGGPQNVGYLKKDAYDHMDRVRRVGKIGNEDAEALMKYFQEKSANEPNFFWRVHLDDEGRLMNLFFRDSRCAEDYGLFGDVVSVDTTFKTNKYNLLCTPFVGMNHHRHTVMFGIGFLSDETAKSFQWLFSIFRESMGGKEPEIIFTDQDQAMKVGIDYAFSRAAHRLCQWHINQNAPAHFGKLKNVKAFKDMWFECMNGCDDEDQFEHVWNTMVDVYNLETNTWFNSMYNLRRRWADVFTKHRFSGGLHATSRSEVTNKVIKDMCAASTSLKEFIVYFERIILDWRMRERQEDAICSRGTPGQAILGNRFLRQGATIYTRNVYKIFEREALSTINVDVVESPIEELGDNSTFRLLSSGSHRLRTVTYNHLADDVSCTCGMLTSWGIFCKHILKVFYHLNLPTLPSKYFLKRWTKKARTASGPLSSTLRGVDGGIDDMLFVHTISRKMYEKAMEWKDASDAREAIIERFEAFLQDISDQNHRPKKRKVATHLPNTEDTFLNPPSPKHPWRPAKRNASVYARKGKNKKLGVKQGAATTSQCP